MTPRDGAKTDVTSAIVHGNPGKDDEEMSTVKRGLALILALLLAAGTLGALADVPNATKAVKITKANFPDARFRSYVEKNLDLNKNGTLSVREIKAVKTLKLKKMGISDLKGIRWLTYLEELDCSGNKLKTLDLGSNKRLKKVNCHKNKIKKLDLHKSESLKELICDKNRLEQLDLSANKRLTRLVCDQNKLKTLDVSKNKHLRELDCGVNALKKLTLGKQKHMVILKCAVNKLKTIDLSGAKLLRNIIRTQYLQPSDVVQSWMMGEGTDDLRLLEVDFLTTLTDGNDILYRP